jgi:hypothetical protein
LANGAPSRSHHCRKTSREVRGSIKGVAIPLKIPWGAGLGVETGAMNQEAALTACATCGRIPEDESAARLT